MNTYYHYQGFVYGPIRKRHYNNGMLKKVTILAQPKYKWTGPPLEDWKEMIEGKDFHIVNKVENDLCPECGSDETRDDLDDTIKKGYRVCDKCLQEYYTSVRYSSHYCKEAIPITK